MKNDLGLLVKDIPKDDLQHFIKNTKAVVEVKSLIDKVKIDYSWIEVFEDAMTSLDTIIRNPKRFLTTEEDIIPIEKTKKVSEESIKHLAVHTNLIQDVDENGDVKPSKLLNIFREETIDLYENRFIYSLINNLYSFVFKQLSYEEKSRENKEARSLKYEANTKFREHDVNIKLDLVSNKTSSDMEDPSEVEKRKERIVAIKEILEGFKASKFMKTMANATPVRSPIRKTNLILKEQNFRKALNLWEFLESYQVSNPIEEIKEEMELTNKSFKKDFGMTYFLNYGILNEIVSNSGSITLPETTDLMKTIFEYAKRFDVDENEFKKDINKEINKVTHYKKEQINKAKEAYDNFIDIHNARMKKTALLFK